MKNLTQISDLTQHDVQHILAVASKYKEKHHLGLRYENVLGGKVVAMIFEKPSLRTKIAFEVATASLGGTPVFLSSAQILASGQQQQGRESVPDIARNLERFADLILARVYHHEVIQEIAGCVTTPVINALCDKHHPTQALADLLAMTGHFGDMKGRQVTYVGDGNNVATSLLQICTLCGISVAIATPEKYRIPESQMKLVREYAEISGVSVLECTDPSEAVLGASVIYSDTFISMGQEDEKARRMSDFEGYQVNSNLMEKAESEAVFMHCLPAHRGEEVTSEVMDSEASIVFDQAECRLHVARALLDVLLTKSEG